MKKYITPTTIFVYYSQVDILTESGEFLKEKGIEFKEFYE